VSPVLYAAVFAAAALLSWWGVGASRALSLRLGAVDHGGGRRVHAGSIPRLGGLGIYAVWVVITVAALAFDREPLLTGRVAGILAGSLLLFAVGWYDDVRSASVRLKFGVQVAAALLVYSCGVRIQVLSNPVGDVFRAGWMELPLTLLWLVAVTNAYNLIDGIDGLAATTGITICAGMALLYTGGDSLGRVAIVALAGALAGFLRHNFPPARIFMGDSGSQSVGFLLGALSLLSFAKASTLAALVLPLVVFGHPLVDLAYAVLRRHHRGQPLGVADREHLHHLLLDRGYSGRTALGLLVLVNLALLVLVLGLSGSRLMGVVTLVALLTIPAGVAFRVLRHLLAGGSVRTEVAALFRSAEHRRARYQARLFRNVAAAGAGQSLHETIREFALKAGLRGVRITLRVASQEERLLYSDETAPSADRTAFSMTVVGAGANFELLDVSVNNEGVAPGDRAGAVHALAAGVRDRLESEADAAAQGSPAAGAPASSPPVPAARPGSVDTRACGNLL
jgi:UDP-GlcNAc:undecaprenyl-phosphate GlcNAc-1-phosphate transferase